MDANEYPTALLYGNTGTAGAAIDQYTCNGQSNQQFQFVPVSGGYGQIQAQTVERNPAGAYRLFRIGDAVAARNTHAAIYDALRLAKDL